MTDETNHPIEISTLSNADVLALGNLNEKLEHLELFLDSLSRTIVPPLVAKIEDHKDPMGDFEVEAQLKFTLTERDPAWRDDSDNFVTTRVEPLKRGLRNREKHACVSEGEARANPQFSEPVCRLMRDLVENDYGPENPSLPLRDCTRLGSVWVDVVIRQQYWLNLETGEWEKSEATKEAPTGISGRS